jgi:hypothetical protein
MFRDREEEFVRISDDLLMHAADGPDNPEHLDHQIRWIVIHLSGRHAREALFGAMIQCSTAAAFGMVGLFREVQALACRVEPMAAVAVNLRVCNAAGSLNPCTAKLDET